MCLGTLGVIGKTWDEGGLTMASVDGRPVCLMYTPEAAVGDTVLVHLGYAVEILGEERAWDALLLRSDLAGLEVRKEAI